MSRGSSRRPRRQADRPIGEAPAPGARAAPEPRELLWWLRNRPAFVRRFALAQVLGAPRGRRRRGRPWHDPQGTP